jgi:hypothetical protein
VAIDTTALAETETVPSGDEDYVENYTTSNTIYITYNGSSASYEGNVSGVSIAISGADVTVTSTTAGVNYVLSGSSTEGSFKMASGDDNKKFELTLAGLSLNNSDGPAINIQAGKRVYVVLKRGTTNHLSDGTSYASSTEDQKGTLFSEGQLLFSGKGSLTVSANTKAGIASDDYILIRPNTNIYVNATQGNGIKSNDGIDIRGGVINVAVSGVAAKGLSTDGYYTQSGGRVTAITTGGAEYDSDENDVSGSAGLKADSVITINGGKLLTKSSGAGGKGISSDQAIVINDGTVKVVTSGKTYTIFEQPRQQAQGHQGRRQPADQWRRHHGEGQRRRGCRGHRGQGHDGHHRRHHGGLCLRRRLQLGLRTHRERWLCVCLLGQQRRHRLQP